MIRLRALLTILIVGGSIYVGSQVAPAYYSYYRFQSDLEELAMIASYSTKSEADIKESVVTRGQDYGIPLRLEQVRVRRAGNDVSISTSYTVHFDIPVYPFDLKFAPATKQLKGSLHAGAND
jgi:hypothetical protein